MQTVYLIQSEQNGYVHIVFNSLAIARQWLAKYHSVTGADRHPYTIIERRVYDNWEGYD